MWKLLTNMVGCRIFGLEMIPDERPRPAQGPPGGRPQKNPKGHRKIQNVRRNPKYSPKNPKCSRIFTLVSVDSLYKRLGPVWGITPHTLGWRSSRFALREARSANKFALWRSKITFKPTTWLYLSIPPGGHFSKNKKLEKLLRFVFVLTIGNSFLHDFQRGQFTNKTKLEKLLRCLFLTIGK